MTPTQLQLHPGTSVGCSPRNIFSLPGTAVACPFRGRRIYHACQSCLFESQLDYFPCSQWVGVFTFSMLSRWIQYKTVGIHCSIQRYSYDLNNSIMNLCLLNCFSLSFLRTLLIFFYLIFVPLVCLGVFFLIWQQPARSSSYKIQIPQAELAC